MGTLELMRAEITRLEQAVPETIRMTLELRCWMMQLTTQVRALRAALAAREKADEPARREALVRSLHRAGDHSLDEEEAA